MRYKPRRNKNKVKNIYKTKIIILCTSIALLVIAGSAVMAQRFISYIDTVQAKDDQIVLNDKNNNKDNDNGDSDNKNSNQVSSENSDIPHDSPEFVQKYLDQQMKGQMPDGADGVKVVYLTFDDGPSETVTPQILDVLKSENVHGTFFVLGKAVDSSAENKELIKRTISEGNAIGIHSYSHNYNYLYPNNKINLDSCMSDFEKTSQSLKNILGQDFTIRAVRFPGGQMTWDKKDPQGAAAMDNALHEKDLHQVDWNALSGDAEGAPKNAEQLTEEAIKTIGKREKVILLMHDTYGKEETAKALPGIIKYLKEQGYEFKILK